MMRRLLTLLQDMWRTMLYGRWHAVHTCSACHMHVTQSERVYRGAVCPWCGIQSGCTILDTDVTTRRWSGGRWEWQRKTSNPPEIP